MLKASAPQKSMRRGSWSLDVAACVLDHRSIVHFGICGSNATGLKCWMRRGGIGFL